MRTEHPIKHKTSIALVTAVVGVVLIGVGAYQYFAVSMNKMSAVVISQPSASVEAGKSNRSLIIHEAGRSVAEISFTDDEGKELSLADFRGRTILLNIWATWCVPCREEMPALDRLQARLGGTGFEVVPLSIDRDGLPKVKAFYEELSLEALGIYVDVSGKAAYGLGAVGIPTTLLINPDGLETGRLVGPAEWDSPEMIDILQQQLETPPGNSN